MEANPLVQTSVFFIHLQNPWAPSKVAGKSVRFAKRTPEICRKRTLRQISAIQGGSFDNAERAECHEHSGAVMQSFGPNGCLADRDFQALAGA
jgi:hypothetical protein